MKVETKETRGWRKKDVYFETVEKVIWEFERLSGVKVGEIRFYHY
jgi:hypothetical protein